MIIQFNWNKQNWKADLSKPVDITIPITSGEKNPNCFQAPAPLFEPVQAGHFIGAIAAGAPVNFFNIHLNPHGNGTHTESLRHISDEGPTVYQALKEFYQVARLLSVTPELQHNDLVITRSLLEKIWVDTHLVKTLIIRTRPNEHSKKERNYSNTNPPYIEPEAMKLVVERGVEHLVVDLPSVDREEDGGLLQAHHIFWNVPDSPRNNATITELVYVPDEISDGLWLTAIHTPALELDAAPSRVLLFSISVTIL
jgi:arylformamidase